LDQPAIGPDNDAARAGAVVSNPTAIAAGIAMHRAQAWGEGA
jgi:hypothetical protein